MASTNAYAIELLAKSKPLDGLVITTDDQYAGEGQFGSKWVSESGQNCTFSLILYPDFLPAVDAFLLNMCVSLGLQEALAAIVKDQTVQIKWPNDILLNGKKISGILIQNTVRGKFLEHAVIGIGINVNQTHFENLPGAGSLRKTTGKYYDRKTVLQNVLQSMEAHYIQLKNSPDTHQLYESWKANYMKHLYLYKKWHTYSIKNKGTLTAQIIDIDHHGRVILEDDQLQTHVCLIKEVELVRI